MAGRSIAAGRAKEECEGRWEGNEDDASRPDWCGRLLEADDAAASCVMLVRRSLTLRSWLLNSACMAFRYCWSCCASTVGPGAGPGRVGAVNGCRSGSTFISTSSKEEANDHCGLHEAQQWGGARQFVCAPRAAHATAPRSGSSDSDATPDGRGLHQPKPNRPGERHRVLQRFSGCDTRERDVTSPDESVWPTFWSLQRRATLTKSRGMFPYSDSKVATGLRSRDRLTRHADAETAQH